MRKKLPVLFVSVLSGLSLLLIPGLSTTAKASTPDQEKDWTFLVYLNAKNNLDRFGTLNMNQMEMAGSNEKVNVVVEWGSASAQTTRRVYVQKDADTTHVTSPVVQDLGKVDMGDWRHFADFIRWGAENYPAKHYFVAIWDHGSGWHLENQARLAGVAPIFQPTDISWDDETGNHMTTEQLGQALNESARLLGRKIDVYGSDACLMAMAEVAGEMSRSVSYFVGSQDLEPGAGWPYDTFLQRWLGQSLSEPRDVAVALAEEYKKSYQGGTNGTKDVTMAAYDMSKLDGFEAAIARLGSSIASLDGAAKAKVMTAVNSTQYFTYNDYADAIDFVNLLDAAKLDSINSDVTASVKDAVSQFVISNQVTPRWTKAHGISFWIPRSKTRYDAFSSRYHSLGFDQRSQWSTALESLLK